MVRIARRREKQVLPPPAPSKQFSALFSALLSQQEEGRRGGGAHLGDVLGGDDERVLAGLGAQQPLRQSDGDDSRGAAHAGQVVGDDVAAHLEVVDHHRAKRGRRVEQRAVHHQDVNVPRSQPCCQDIQSALV